MSKSKHYSRLWLAIVGAVLLVCGLSDGMVGSVPYVDSKLLVGMGAVLLGLSARKRIT